MTQQMILLVVWCSIIAMVTAQVIPADWNQRVQAGEMLFSATAPDSSMMGSEAPSHRARIPATTAISIKSASIIGYALDLQQAVFYLRSTVANVNIEQRWYAHQVNRYLLIHEINYESTSTSSSVIELSLNTGGSSSDINFVNTTNDWGNLMVGNIITPEEPNGEAVSVAVAYTAVNSNITIPAGAKGTYYFVTAVRTSLDSSNPQDDVIPIFKQATVSAPQLLASHIEAWNGLWQSGLEVGFEDILSSVRDDWPFSLSPGGLASNGYNGHTFWDCETWMYPNMLLLQPSIAASLIQYRFNRIPGAMLKAQSYNKGYKGFMFPWESAFTGQEVCPSWAPTGQLEQHITGDIALAIRQYYEVTRDDTWLKAIGFPLLTGIADFWVSRVALQNGVYVIDGVIPPDEYP